jgi:predicted DNA-binding transcriptional regulator AlpA
MIKSSNTTARRHGKGYKLGPHAAKPIPAGAVWMTAKQVCDRYGGRSEMWLWREIKDNPNFPKPRFHGRLRIFSVVEFDNYDKKLPTAKPAPRKSAVQS